MSPYASRAQQRKFHQLEKEGKISHKIVREYDDASKDKKLPERLHPKKKIPMQRKDMPHPHRVIHETMQALNG